MHYGRFPKVREQLFCFICTDCRLGLTATDRARPHESLVVTIGRQIWTIAHGDE
jgi:hypothetical protein